MKLKLQLKDFIWPCIGICSGFLFFENYLVIAQIILGIAVWYLIHEKKKSEIKLSNHSEKILLVLLAILIILPRLYPFFISTAPLGYDTGIYRYEFWNSFQALPEYLSGIFLGLPLLSNAILLSGLPLDVTLYSLYLLFAILAAMSLAVLVREEQGKEEAVVVVLLFALSLVQWKAFTMVLFKQMLSLSLICYSFLLVRRSSFLVLIPVLFLSLLQPLDALFVGLSIAAYLFWVLFSQPKNRRYAQHLLLLGTAAILGLLWSDASFWTSAWDSFQVAIGGQDIGRELQQGLFISLADYGYQAAFFFVFGVLGWVMALQKKQMSPMLIFLGILLLWIAARLFFFQRLLIQFDFALLFFAASPVLKFFKQSLVDQTGKSIVAIIFLGVAIPFMYQLSQYQPLIEEKELTDIQSFCQQIPPQSLVAATDSFYSPWLRGYCLDQRVIAPGLFEYDQWRREDWIGFWKGEKAQLPELIGRYEEQVYFYRGQQQPAIAFPDEYFERAADDWWKSKPIATP